MERQNGLWTCRDSEDDSDKELPVEIDEDDDEAMVEEFIA